MVCHRSRGSKQRHLLQASHFSDTTSKECNNEGRHTYSSMTGILSSPRLSNILTFGIVDYVI